MKLIDSLIRFTTARDEDEVVPSSIFNIRIKVNQLNYWPRWSVSTKHFSRDEKAQARKKDESFGRIAYEK